MKNFKIFIQARIGSSRLPGKALINFFGEKIIDRVIRIAKRVNTNKNIYLLTGNIKSNFSLKEIAKKHKINFFSGHEDNVLRRFCDLILKKKMNNTNILRMTADNYLIQPDILQKLIKKHFEDSYEYSYIKGLSHFSGEVVSAKALLLNYKNKPSKKSKLHVTYDARNRLKIKKKILDKNFCNLNHRKAICLDNVSDLVFLKKIENLYPGLKKLNCIKLIKKIQKIHLK